MKKLLTLIITMVLVISLGACNNAPDDYATKSELELLQDEITALEERIDNLVVSRGINGQIDVYENQSLVDELNVALVVLSTELQVLSVKEDKVDKTKLPEYMFDEFGSYVSFNDLGGLLKQKYFGYGSSDQDLYDVGDNAYMRFYFSGDETNEEILAKTVLLIEEIRNYTEYTISYSQLEIHVYRVSTIDNVDRQIHIAIPLNIILNDAYTVDIETIYNSWFEIEYDGVLVDLELAITIYDEYITNETYTGYVLNYK